MYNKPQGSLMSRLNITNFTSELNSRPPYNIKLSEIEPLRNGYHIKNNAQLGGYNLLYYFLLKIRLILLLSRCPNSPHIHN